MEDYFLGKATERIFLPLLKMLIPDIVDYSLPVSGVFHNCAFVRIRKEYPLQARRVMRSIQLQSSASAKMMRLRRISTARRGTSSSTTCVTLLPIPSAFGALPIS
jgi:hypothetical protein